MAPQAAVGRLQQHTSARGPLGVSSGLENGSGMLSSHRLPPDLAAFIARVGLTALLEAHLPVKIAGPENPGLVRMAPVKRVSCPHRPAMPCREQVAQCSASLLGRF
jgi:hypothetical protein